MCVLVVSGTGLTGCSEDPDEGTNGVGRLPAAEIQRKTRTAADSADAVRLSGNVVTSGRTYRLDMRLKSDGATGSVTSQGSTFQLLRVGEQLYLKADAGFWSDADGEGGTGAAAADKLDGKYVKVPQGDPSYKKFSGFTDKDVLLDGLLTLHGTLATDGHHEQAGTRTIRITGDAGSGGTLDVSLEGTPYPLRLTRAGGGGTLTFSAWGADFALEKPAKDETVDYGRQLPTS
ncbi:putative Lipoprotein [Streptomyces viridochromogenes Tue57]|uniref:Putative Lipoprotein n=1 Tax=Streptomyces viridochromogenes Tue57 TaxID=1160705 RepID=L8PJ69_STRVR|nr:putative Lipoprotein [Streptomyces viridochromogenes Tue57]